MANYYELINVKPESSPAEIEAAIDEQYQKWNQLVTHHDQKVAAQANQAKQTLQEIRTTLLDAAKRKVYDNAIGLGDTIGGLGDPEAILQAMSTPIGVPMGVPRAVKKQDTKELASQARTDAWICPKCSKANPIGTTYCDKCGYQLAALCPNCETLSELEKPFCPKCGCQKHEVFEEKKNIYIKKLNQEKENLTARKTAVESGNYAGEYELSSIQDDAQKKTTRGIIWTILFIISLFLLGTTEGNILFCSVPLLLFLIISFANSSSKKTALEKQANVTIHNLNSQIQTLQARVKMVEDSFYKNGINIHELVNS